MDGTEPVTQFGLYYPYINFRDEAWAKLAALYWPRMARIRPKSYPTRNLPAIQALIDELDWVIDVSPDEANENVAPTFDQLLGELSDSGEDWMPGQFYRVEPEVEAITAPEWGAGPATRGIWGARLNERVAAIHSTEFSTELCHRLIDLSYAIPAPGESARLPVSDEVEQRLHPWLADVLQSRDDPPVSTFIREGGWLIMHRDLVWVYKCLLSECMASRNRLTLTTDQISAHAAASGLSATQLALGGISGRRMNGDLATAFGLTAIKAAVPKDLLNVPVEKIVEVRQRYGTQFDAWREYIDAVGRSLAEQLRNVDSPEILDAYLQEAARRYAEAPVDQLRDGLERVGLDAAESTLNTKFETPALIAAAGLATANPIAVAAGAAVGVVHLRRQLSSRARDQLASPGAYLFTLHEQLESKSWIKRVVEAMKNAAGLRG